MKITIDTKQDSRDEIRKVIRLLYDLLEGKDDSLSQGSSSGYSGSSSLQSSPGFETYPSYRQEEKPAASPAPQPEGFFNMFADNSSYQEPQQTSTYPASIDEKKEEKKPEFEIYEY